MKPAGSPTMDMDNIIQNKGHDSPFSTLHRSMGGEWDRKVVLISPYGIENRGIRYVSSLLRSYNFKSSLIFFKRWMNNRIREPSQKEMDLLVSLVSDISPGLVGFGFGAPYLRIVKRLTELIRASSGIPVLWGGVYPTVRPEESIRHADAVCIGEGEHLTLELCRSLAGECGLDGIRDIKGLWFREEGKVVKNGRRPLNQDLDGLPFPDYLKGSTYFIEDNRVREQDPIAGTAEYRIYPTRGCPYSCAYCSNGSLKKITAGKGERYYRIRSADNVIRELEYARRLLPRIRRVKFDGDVFSFPKGWIEKFSVEYKDRIRIPFELLTYPGELDSRDMSLLKKAGLRKIQAGIQSGSDLEVHEIYGRRSTAGGIRELSSIAHRAGVEVVYDLIFDNPLSTTGDKQAIVELLLELERPFKIYLYSLTLFPGTTMAEDFINKGIATENDIEGNSTKSFRQFRLSFDYPRSSEDEFWISLSILAAKSFVPRAAVRRLMKSEWLMNHSAPVKTAARITDLAKAAAIASRMLLDGELTLFKIRQYGSLKNLMSQ